MAVLDVTNLSTDFHTRHGVVRAVNGVSFTLSAGETLGIVGESGSGKSVTCLSLLGLIPRPPGRIAGGTAWFGETDLLSASERELRKVRGRRIATVFQDPMTSLNPYLPISTQMVEGLTYHFGMRRRAALDRAVSALREAGIRDAGELIRHYPHEFSGGMRQRVMIATCLAMEPEVLVADEPTTALDVTVQAEILLLMRGLQKRHGTGVILITHDLGVVAGMCDRVAVMYAGLVLETGSCRDVFYRSSHPYTQALARSLPSLHRKGRPLYTIPGAPPDKYAETAGCPFRERCEHATPACTGEPALVDVGDGHLTRCIRVANGDLGPLAPAGQGPAKGGGR